VNPKLFISYSWSSSDHEAWVLRLATDLRENGVDVILDKWDLKEGHDANAFMERMVTDDDIKKVVMVCDRVYVEKANNRKGGVGTETQIITPDIYAKQDQSKFVAVITECDDEGKPYVPAYFRSRIHIDFTDDSEYSSRFEQLVRWVYDQPIYVKPELGAKPAFLADDDKKVKLATSARFRRAIDAMKSGRDYAAAAAQEYLSTITTEFEKLRLDPDAAPFDDAVVDGIEAFLPYRNELIEFFATVARYRDTEEMRTIIHRFFESLIPYMDRPAHVNRWSAHDFDNFKFVIHELFLYLIAVAIQHSHFDMARHFLEKEYYVPGNTDYGRDAMVPYMVFDPRMEAFEERKRRLNLNRTSLEADYLNQRCNGVGVDFRQLMGADFVMWLRGEVLHRDMRMWWPNTLVYIVDRGGAFELFSRAKSTAFFDRMKGLIGVASKEALETVVQESRKQQNSEVRVPRWNYFPLNIGALMGMEKLASTP
jgi:TIR domain